MMGCAQTSCPNFEVPMVTCSGTCRYPFSRVPHRTNLRRQAPHIGSRNSHYYSASILQHIDMNDKDRLSVRHHGAVDNVIPSEFPPGQVYLDALKMHGVGVPKHQQDPRYWQACARWALLQKFRLWNDKDCIEYTKQRAFSAKDQQETVSSLHLELTEDQSEAINR